MDLGDVMEEVGEVLDTIDKLRVYDYLPGSVSPPAAVVEYPTVVYDETMARGMDRYTVPITVLVGNVTERTARDRISRYARGTGAQSFKTVLEAHTWESCDTVRLMGAEPGIKRVADIDYLTYSFDLDVAGTGAL